MTKTETIVESAKQYEIEHVVEDLTEINKQYTCKTSHRRRDHKVTFYFEKIEMIAYFWDKLNENLKLKGYNRIPFPKIQSRKKKYIVKINYNEVKN